VRDNPKQWVDDYNRKVLKGYGDGECASLAQRGRKRDSDEKGVEYMPHDRSRYPYWRGTFSRSTTKRESAASHQTGNNQAYHVSMSPHHGRTSRSNKKVSLKTWHSPSSTSDYCVTASRMDKDDEEVNEGDDKGRTEMQKFTMFFPFSLS
jgi:hypothetical protein